MAFESKARNLVLVTPGQPSNEDDSEGQDAKKRIFVHDADAGELSLVSVSTAGIEADRDASDAAISADGRYVAFVSKARNLVLGDVNEHSDVFVHNRDTGETTRVSVASDGSEGNHHATSPSMNADGRYVAFVSKATNLVPGDTNAAEDVFRHDLETGETIRVSVSTDGVEGAGTSGEPSVNATGRFITFVSKSENLVPTDANHQRDVFVRDVSREITLLVSVASDGGGADKMSQEPSVSGDGSLVAFGSKARNLVPVDTNKKDDVFATEVGLNRPPVARR